MSWWTNFRDGVLRSVGLKKKPAKIGAAVGSSFVAANSGARHAQPFNSAPTVNHSSGTLQSQASSFLNGVNFTDPKTIAVIVGAIWLLKR